MNPEIEQLLRGIKWEIGNERHIQISKMVGEIQRLLRAKKPNRKEIENKERQLIWQLKNLCGNPAQNQ